MLYEENKYILCGYIHPNPGNLSPILEAVYLITNDIDMANNVMASIRPVCHKTNCVSPLEPPEEPYAESDKDYG